VIRVTLLFWSVLNRPTVFISPLIGVIFIAQCHQSISVLYGLLGDNLYRPANLTLTFDLSTQNRVTCRLSQGHALHYTKFKHFGIIRFLVMLRINRQTDKQTDEAEHPTQLIYSILLTMSYLCCCTQH